MSFLTIAEIAVKKNTTKYSVQRWLKSGLKHQKFGRTILIESRDLAKFKPRRVGNPGSPNGAKARWAKQRKSAI